MFRLLTQALSQPKPTPQHKQAPTYIPSSTPTISRHPRKKGLRNPIFLLISIAIAIVCGYLAQYTSQYTISLRRIVDAPIERAWTVVIDPSLYAHHLT